MPDIYDETDNKKVSVIDDRNDNVVAIKRKLRKKIYKSETKLQLLNDGKLLDNNRYLPDGTGRLDYRIIKGDSSDVIIKVARNKYKIPKRIQIDKRDTITQLESVLTSFSDGVVNLAIFSDSGERLKTSSTVEESGLVNDCEIRVWHPKDANQPLSLSLSQPQSQSQLLSLSVTTFNPVETALTINCGILDTVQQVKESIHDKVQNLITDEMAIFTKSEFLETDRQLIDYCIGDGDLIFYVDLLKKDEIEVGNKFKKGQFATLHYGKNLKTDTDIVVKKYKLNKGDKLSNFKALKYELTTFLKLRDEENSRFVNLDSMFEDKSMFHIGMEHMKGGSLDALLPLNEHFHDPQSTIINFSIPILEALAVLHEKSILYRSMKCSSVLLDENHTTVKLGCFKFSKIAHSSNKNKLEDGMLGPRPSIYNWAAPEMLSDELYGFKADIWSFGATLVEMVTGQAPYANLKPPQVLDKITTLKKIEYKQPDWMSNDLKGVIEKCLKPDQQDRPTVNELKELFVKM